MKAKRILFPLISLVLVCLYPCAFQYFRNASEARPGDMVPMLAIFLGMALGAFLISLLIFRKIPQAGLFASVAMFFATNSGLFKGLLKRAIPGFRGLYVLVILGILLLLLMLLLLKKKKFPALELCQVLVILFGVLTLVSMIPALPTLWKQITFQKNPGTIDVSDVTLQGDKPNVYYLLVDEYGGTENLTRYYDYDNHEFLDYLRQKGFNISNTTENTESIWTMTLVPNLLNLDYMVEDTSENKSAYMDKSNLVEIFRGSGYQVNLIDHVNFVGTSGCRVLSPRQYPDSISKYLFRNSVLSQIPQLRRKMDQILGLPNEFEEAKTLQTLFGLMESAADYVEDSPTLTVSYVQCPHYPFLFDAEGNIKPSKPNFQDKSIYLGQLQYVTSVLEQSVQNILDQDPDSIIVIQSDHGARYPGQMLLYHGGPDYDPVLETPYMQNALDCVYVRGEKLDIEGLSGINTLRTVLNSQFGTDLPMLEQPTGYTCYGKSWADNPDWLEEVNR